MGGRKCTSASSRSSSSSRKSHSEFLVKVIIAQAVDFIIKTTLLHLKRLISRAFYDKHQHKELQFAENRRKTHAINAIISYHI